MIFVNNGPIGNKSTDLVSATQQPNGTRR